MGGGGTDRPEARKHLRGKRTGREVGGAGASALEPPICERTQTLSFLASSPVSVGDAVRVVRANPPAIVVGSGPVGFVADGQQAATITACLDDGYAFVGEIVKVDAQVGSAEATVVGLRSS